MIYIYTEDKNEGMVLMKNAIDIYLSGYNIIVDTLDGIKNLQDNIKKLQLNAEDTVYYVYDDVSENADVQNHLKNGKREISRSKYKGQINLIPIFCCEHSILTAMDIEKFSHPDVLKVILEVQGYKDLRNITKMTKQNNIFDVYYTKARTKRENTLKRLQRNKGITYTQNDIEIGVSAEKLYKEIIKDALRPPLALTATLGDCWTHDCCINKKRVCSMYINNSVLYEAEKKQFLVDRTVYIKIIKRIANEQGLKLNVVQALNLDDKKLSKKAMKIIQDFNTKNHKRILECEQHIEQYVLNSDDGYTDLEVVNYCTSIGYTEIQARCAIDHITKRVENIT